MWDKYPYYDWTQVALGGFYGVLLLISVYCMLRQQSGWKLSWQRMFHIIIFVGSLTRVVFFSVQPWVSEGKISMPNQVNIIMNSLPTFFFFSTYLLLIFLWAELVHKTRYVQFRQVEKNMGINLHQKKMEHSSNLRSLRWIYLTFNLFLFALLSVLYILDNTLYSPKYTTEPKLTNKIEETIWFYTAFLALGTALAFLIYGLVLMQSLLRGSSWRIMPEQKKKALLKVALISSLCTLAFGIRSTMDILEITVASFQTSWWLNGLLWITLEYVPLLLILYILTVHERPKSVEVPSVVEEGRRPSTRTTTPSHKYSRLPISDDIDSDDYTDFTSPSPSPSPSPSGSAFHAYHKANIQAN